MSRRNALPVLVSVMFGAAMLLPQTETATATTLPATIAPPITAGRYLVKFVPGTDADAQATTLAGLGINVVQVYRKVFSGVAVVAEPGSQERVCWGEVNQPLSEDCFEGLRAKVVAHSCGVATSCRGMPGAFHTGFCDPARSVG